MESPGLASPVIKVSHKEDANTQLSGGNECKANVFVIFKYSESRLQGVFRCMTQSGDRMKMIFLWTVVKEESPVGDQ